MTPSARIRHVNVARAATIDIQGRRVLTAIGKQPVLGAVAVAPLGLAGDEQADLTVHGGLAKAVYAYPAEHLPFWQTVRAQARVAAHHDPVPPGLLGENLTIEGLTEDRLWIGDRLRLRRVLILDAQGNRNSFVFSQVQVNTTVPASTFVFEPPAGTTVVRP